MNSSQFADRLHERARERGLTLTEGQGQQLERYYALLRRWNKQTNLTSLALELPPGDQTIDRLFLEPLVAAGLLEDKPLECYDLGSGGGSPAIPLKVFRRNLALTMVEARERKTAFLRETVRHLGLTGVTVLTARAEDLPASTCNAADVVTIRAVRMDAALLAAILRLLKPTGHLVTFGSAAAPTGFAPRYQTTLLGSTSSVRVLSPIPKVPLTPKL